MFGQIKHIIFVNTGRYNQKWAVIDFFCYRLEMNQLEKFVLEYHGTWSGGNILSQFKGRFIGHTDATFIKIMHQLFKAIDQVLTFAFQRLLEHFGIRQCKIGGWHCVDILARIKFSFSLCCFIHGGIRNHSGQHAWRQQIWLLDIIVQWTLFPFRGGKSPVSMHHRLSGTLWGWFEYIDPYFKLILVKSGDRFQPFFRVFHRTLHDQIPGIAKMACHFLFFRNRKIFEHVVPGWCKFFKQNSRISRFHISLW